MASDATSRFRQHEQPSATTSGGSSPEGLTAKIREAIADHPYLCVVNVVATPGALPRHVQAYLREEGLDPTRAKGVYTHGASYLIGGNIESIEDGIRTALHEVVGHQGVQTLLSDRFEPVMREVYGTFPRQHDAWQTTATRYGYLDTGTDAGKVAFAEELTAHLAETDVELAEFDMIKAEIRGNLREHLPELPVTEEEVKALIQRSRESLIMRHGSPEASEEILKKQARRTKVANMLMGSMSRNGKGMPDALSLQLHKDGSQVLDADGIPCRLYHGGGTEVKQIEGTFWGTTDPAFANEYAEMRADQGKNASIVPYYASIQRPFNGDALKGGGAAPGARRNLTAKTFAQELVTQANLEGQAADTISKMGQRLYLLGRIEESGPTYRPHDFWYGTRSMFGREGEQLIQEMFHLAGFDGIRYTELDHVTYGAFTPAQLHFLDQGASPRGWQPDRHHGEGPVTERAAFKEWFGDSQVVTPSGAAKRMFHATTGDIVSFDGSFVRPTDLDADCNGFWFSSRSDTQPATQTPSTIMPVYLAIESPAPYDVVQSVASEVRSDGKLRPKARSVHDEVRYRLQEQGYDGFFFKEPLQLTDEQRKTFARTGVLEAEGRDGAYTLRSRQEPELAPTGKQISMVDYFTPGVGHVTSYESLEAFEQAQDEMVAVAFRPEQIKSAIGNRGTFLSNHPDVRFSLRRDPYSMTVGKAADEAALLAQRVQAAYEQGFDAEAERLDARLEALYQRIEDGLYVPTSINEPPPQWATAPGDPLDDEDSFEVHAEDSFDLDLGNRYHALFYGREKDAVTESEKIDLLRACVEDYAHFHGGLRDGLRDEEILAAAAEAYRVVQRRSEHGIGAIAFKHWFGNSKVIDDLGLPLSVYHGTPELDFDRFEKKGINEGFCFTPTVPLAEGFAGPNGRVIEAKLSLQNPIDMRSDPDAWEAFHGQGLVKQLIEQGYDGAIFHEPEGDFAEGNELVYLAFQADQINVVKSTPAFSPAQIKSVENVGSYDPLNQDIRFSSADAPATPLPGSESVDGEGLTRVAEHQQALDFDTLSVQISADSYNHTEIRPETKAVQKELGRSALADLHRHLTSRFKRQLGTVRDPEERVSLVGAAISRDFIAGRPAQLLNRRIRISEDLAALAQVYRDPRFETLRFMLMRGNKVIGETAVTSRMPSSVSMGPAAEEKLEQLMRDAGADGYYVLHNHPSGISSPSDADIRFTQAIAAAVPGFRSHVIIDHNEYSTIDHNGVVDTVFVEEFEVKQFSLEPTQPHPVLGRTIRNEREAAEAIKVLNTKAGDAVIIGTSMSTGSTRIVTSLPLDYIDYVHANANDPAVRNEALAALRQLLRAGGAGGHTFLVMPEVSEERLLQYEWLMESGLFRDVFSHEGDSLGFKMELARSYMLHANPIEATARGMWRTDLAAGTSERGGSGDPGKDAQPQVPDVGDSGFADWFEGSRVVDATGLPIPVYHGGPTKGIKHFKGRMEPVPLPGETINWTGEQEVIYFNSDKAAAKTYGKHLYEAYLQLRNPLVIDAKGQEWGDVLPSRHVPQAVTNGHDGIIVTNIIDVASVGGMAEPATVYMVFDPEQIRLSSEVGKQHQPRRGASGQVKLSSTIPGTPTQAVLGVIAESTGAHPEEAVAPGLEEWFGESRVVDGEGKPLVVYHGTVESFSEFEAGWIGTGNGLADFGEGLYFSNLPNASSEYAEGPGGNVMPVYLNIKNPAGMDIVLRDDIQAAHDDDMGFTSVAEALEKLGYDGIAVDREGGTEYVVFHPEQIRSVLDPANYPSFQPARNLEQVGSLTPEHQAGQFGGDPIMPALATEGVKRGKQILAGSDGQSCPVRTCNQAIELSHIDQEVGSVVNATRGGVLIQQVATELLDLLEDAGHQHGWMDGGCRIFAESLCDWSKGKIQLAVTSQDDISASHAVGVLLLTGQPEGPCALIDADGLATPAMLMEKLSRLEASPGEKLEAVAHRADALVQSLPMDESVASRVVQGLELALGPFENWERQLAGELELLYEIESQQTEVSAKPCEPAWQEHGISTLAAPEN